MPMTLRRIAHVFGRHYWVPGILYVSGQPPTSPPDRYYCYFCDAETTRT